MNNHISSGIYYKSDIIKNVDLKKCKYTNKEHILYHIMIMGEHNNYYYNDVWPNLKFKAYCCLGTKDFKLKFIGLEDEVDLIYKKLDIDYLSIREFLMEEFKKYIKYSIYNQLNINQESIFQSEIDSLVYILSFMSKYEFYTYESYQDLYV